MKRRPVCIFSAPYPEVVKRSGREDDFFFLENTYEILKWGRHAPSARVDLGNRTHLSGKSGVEDVRV